MDAEITPPVPESSLIVDPKPVEIPPVEEIPQSIELPPQQPKWPDKPWLAIWTAPRSTIRMIVDTNPTRYVLLLAALGGVVGSLDRASGRSTGDTLPVFMTILIAIIAGSLGGFLSLYIGAAVFRWTGSWFGGQASSEQVRAAIAWSLVPQITSLVLWIPYLALYGEEMFTSSSYAPRIANNPEPLFVLGMLQIALGIWTLFLMIKTVAEVHRFSAWRSLAALTIPLVVLYGLVFGLVLIMVGGGL